MRRLVRIAHSPDADDIFMYYALAFGWVGARNVVWENHALDIETLNQKALTGFYDVSAISFALYPHIVSDYALLRTGVSFGEGYGPKLVKRRETRLKRCFKVALSGRYTTNAMLFRIAYPEARVVYKNFLEIEEAVLSGEVDAGVLIHESILNFSKDLCVEREIWEVWCALIQGEMPLPLGGMAIRRSIPLLAALELEVLLSEAVVVARKNPALLSHMLHERGLLRVEGEELERYLSLYANAHSVSMGEAQLTAVEQLFRLGYDHGIYEQPLSVEDLLLPSEYATLRRS